MSGNIYLTSGASGVSDLLAVASNQTSAGAGDAGKIVALNSAGLIDSSMLPSEDVISVTSSEAISAGALINLWISTGLKVRNADNGAAAKWAMGWAPSAISNGGTGNVNIGEGQNT